MSLSMNDYDGNKALFINAIETKSDWTIRGRGTGQTFGRLLAALGEAIKYPGRWIDFEDHDEQAKYHLRMAQYVLNMAQDLVIRASIAGIDGVIRHIREGEPQFFDATTSDTSHRPMRSYERDVFIVQVRFTLPTMPTYESIADRAAMPPDARDIKECGPQITPSDS